MSLFVSDAFAAAGAAHGAPSDSTFSFIMIAAIFVLFYFMLIRPQNKRAKDHRELVSKLQKGDEIITSGGIVAKVSSVDEQFIKVLITEGVEISLQRNSVTSVLPKGTLKAL
jgi:preprotein translocase subunit YajC